MASDLSQTPENYDIQSPEKIAEEHEILMESLRALVSGITSGTPITIQEIENGFELTVPLPDRRSQKVYMTLGRRDADGENLFQVFTICAEADPSIYEPALKMNMEMDYGALGIQEIYGKSYLVIVDTQLIRTAQPVEIEKAILTLAEVGDDLERILTGQDVR